ncbi:MAG: NAD-dependent deacylase [Thermoanaerobaculia bacterium]|nr:NAD-dependent deacylase [Thermoanaerobaculia bacterium]
MNELIEWISRERPSRVVVLTGAGVSAESGIPTFRGQGGLWEKYSLEDLATPEGFAKDPELVWRWYEWRRSAVRKASPNAAHRAIADLETSGRLDEFLLVTQNVDELHRRAGSERIIELHGSIVRSRCVEEGTTASSLDPFDVLPPACSCGSLMRPDVVWFGEALSIADLQKAAEVAERSDLLMVVGTSAQVWPAAGIAYHARGKTVEVNPEQTAYSEHADFVIPRPAAEAVPVIVEAILEARS